MEVNQKGYCNRTLCHWATSACTTYTSTRRESNTWPFENYIPFKSHFGRCWYLNSTRHIYTNYIRIYLPPFSLPYPSFVLHTIFSQTHTNIFQFFNHIIHQLYFTIIHSIFPNIMLWIFLVHVYTYIYNLWALVLTYIIFVPTKNQHKYWNKNALLIKNVFQLYVTTSFWFL